MKSFDSKRKYSKYYWYLTTSDKYELPITPIADNACELADFANAMGIKTTPSRLEQMYSKRQSQGKRRKGNAKFEIVRILKSEIDEDLELKDDKTKMFCPVEFQVELYE